MKKILITILVLLMSLISVNAITTLNTCGTPVGGWQDNEIYIVDLQQDVSKANYGTDAYCFRLEGSNTGMSFRSITPFNLIDKTLFRIYTTNTNLNIENFDITSKLNPSTYLFVDYYNTLSDSTQTINLQHTYRNIKFVDYFNNDKDVFHFFSSFIANGNIGITYDDLNIINSKFDVPNLEFVTYTTPSKYSGSDFINYVLSQTLNLNNNGNIIISKKISYSIPSPLYAPCSQHCVMGCIINYCTRTYYAGNTIVGGSNSIIAESVPTSTYYRYDLTNSIVKGYSFEDVNNDGFADDSTVYNTTIHDFSNMRTFLELFGTTYIQDPSTSYELSGFSNRNIVDLNGFFGMGYNGYYYKFNSGAISNIINCKIVDYLNLSGPLASLMYGNNLENCNVNANNNIYTLPIDSNMGIIEVTGNNIIQNNQFNIGNNIQLDVIKDISQNGLSGISIINNDFTKISSGLDGLDFIDINPHKTSRIIGNYFGTSATGSVTYMNFNNAVLDSGNTLLIEKNEFTNVNQETDKILMKDMRDKSKVIFFNNFIGKNLQLSNVDINLYGTKDYYYLGKLYTFNVGNYYEDNIDCTDNNIDGICDNPYIFNGIVDLYPLYNYPYNYEQYIASAINSVNVTTDFNVIIVQPTNLNNVIVSETSKTYSLVFNHNSNVNMDVCNIYLNDNIIDSYYDVSSGNKNYLLGNLNEQTYLVKVDCSIGDLIKSSTTNVFTVSYGTPITTPISGGGGGGGGGGGTPIPYDSCVEPDFKFESCSNGGQISTFACIGTEWIPTGESCDKCAWWNPFCSDNNVRINESIDFPIFNPNPIIDIPFLEIEKKEVCDITIEPSELKFTNDGQIEKFTITNNEDGSYSPDYKFISSENYDSAIQSLSITNEIGTLQPKGSVDVGIKYSVGTFTPKVSYDKLLLIHSECADVELLINTNGDVGLLGGKFGGSKYNIPNIRLLSELFGISTLFDLFLVTLTGSVFTYLNWNKRYYKKGKKNNKKNIIIKSLIVVLWTVFSTTIILALMTFIFA